MQNKANFCRFWPKNGHLWKKQSQTNPIQSQNKPNSNPISSAAKMEVTDFMTGLYENIRLYGRAENKPKQSQFRNGVSLTRQHIEKSLAPESFIAIITGLEQS
jgi:hypothetical protein